MKPISRIIDYFAQIFESPEVHQEATLLDLDQDVCLLRHEAVRHGSNKTILYISPTTLLAMDRAQELGFPSNVYFAPVGAALIGCQFEELIVDADCILYLKNKGWGSLKIDDYINTMLATRVSAYGRMRFIQ